MPTIHFVQSNGETIVANVPVGSSVMQGAMDSMVEGILAECGGGCSCATCHVYIDEAWMPKVGEACDIEKEMLEAGLGMQHNSRLSCQVEVTNDLDGLVVRVPAEQN